jgi:hypothetical protein
VIVNLPWSSATVDRVPPVRVFSTDTAAPGNIACCSSATVPRIVTDTDCAAAATAKTSVARPDAMALVRMTGGSSAILYLPRADVKCKACCCHEAAARATARHERVKKLRYPLALHSNQRTVETWRPNRYP